MSENKDVPGLRLGELYVLANPVSGLYPSLNVTKKLMVDIDDTKQQLAWIRRYMKTHECTVLKAVDAYEKMVVANHHRLVAELKRATDFIEAIIGYYGHGLEVANWHQNGDTEPFDNFIDDNLNDVDVNTIRELLEKVDAV